MYGSFNSRSLWAESYGMTIQVNAFVHVLLFFKIKLKISVIDFGLWSACLEFKPWASEIGSNPGMND